MDITYCSNEHCDQKKECLRSLDNLKSNRSWLSVAVFFPDDNNYCNRKLELSKKEKLLKNGKDQQD